MTHGFVKFLANLDRLTSSQHEEPKRQRHVLTRKKMMESAIISRIREYCKNGKNSKVKITKITYLCHFSVRPIAEETSNLRFVRSTT